MEGFRSKYSGAEVEERLDKVSDIQEEQDELKDDVADIQNAISATNLAVATPTIDVRWTAFNYQGVELASLPYEDGTKSNPVLEVGYKLRYNATYKWTAESGKQKPRSVDTANSNWGATLPASGVNSAEITNETLVTSNTTLKITLQAPEVGLKVNDQKYIVPASGSVKSSASVGAAFRYRMYHGVTTTSNIDDILIKGLSSKSLSHTHVLELQNMSTVSGQYYLYAYPVRLNRITADGGTVWDKSIQDSDKNDSQAFIEREIEVINDAGQSIKYYAYRTKQDGSLSNTTLKFS